MRCLPCLLVALLWTELLGAWNHMGHMVLSEIARRQLPAHVQAQVEAAVRSCDLGDPETETFVTASCWPDRMKSRRCMLFNRWHYIDRPWDPDGILDADRERELHGRLSREHAGWVIRQTQAMLRSQKAGPFERAFAIRFLMHCVGDLHMPLHCIYRVTTDYPESDWAAGAVQMAGPNPSNLHTFWDAAGGQLPEIEWPLSIEDRQLVDEIADRLLREHDTLPELVAEENPVVWSLESYQIATDVAYNFEDGSAPSADYVERSRKISEERLVLAGRRLGRLLMKLYEPR